MLLLHDLTACGRRSLLVLRHWVARCRCCYSCHLVALMPSPMLLLVPSAAWTVPLGSEVCRRYSWCHSVVPVMHACCITPFNVRLKRMPQSHVQHAPDTTRRRDHMCKLTATHHSMQDSRLGQRTDAPLAQLAMAMVAQVCHWVARSLLHGLSRCSCETCAG